MTYFTNDLHEALLQKSGQEFWKIWKSKFDDKSNGVLQINGVSDPAEIVINFAKHFEKVCSPFSMKRNDELKAAYFQKRLFYDEPLVLNNCNFSVELLSDLLSKMKNGKAPGLDDLTCEHLKYSHPIVLIILSKLFEHFLTNGHVPACFGKSYTVPVPKCKGHNPALGVEDFRGISISPVISKLFEHAILNRFAHLFGTSEYQFGFKKHLSCRHLIYNVRNVIEHYISNCSTVNVCTLDLSKAFDRMNHYALFMKLMNKRFPNELLTLLDHWFSISKTCVKWSGAISDFFSLSAGVRQGGVLSPYLFGLFIDSVVDTVRSTGVGCYMSCICMSIFLYADDILLIAPSVTALQTLLSACEEELISLDMQINTKKIGMYAFWHTFNVQCENLQADNGSLFWSKTCRYLGVYFVSGRTFKCTFDHMKSQYFKAFNSILSKVGRFASEEIVLSLLRAKCVPVLLYGIEACPVLKHDIRSLEFTVTRSLMKLFRTGSPEIVSDCQKFFHFLPIAYMIDLRIVKFLEQYMASNNIICRLFYDHAESSLNKIFLKYGTCVNTSCELRYLMNSFFV